MYYLVHLKIWNEILIAEDTGEITYIRDRAGTKSNGWAIGDIWTNKNITFEERMGDRIIDKDEELEKIKEKMYLYLL